MFWETPFNPHMISYWIRVEPKSSETLYTKRQKRTHTDSGNRLVKTEAETVVMMSKHQEHPALQEARQFLPRASGGSCGPTNTSRTGKERISAPLSFLVACYYIYRKLICHHTRFSFFLLSTYLHLYLKFSYKQQKGQSFFILRFLPFHWKV